MTLYLAGFALVLADAFLILLPAARRQLRTGCPPGSLAWAGMGVAVCGFALMAAGAAYAHQWLPAAIAAVTTLVLAWIAGRYWWRKRRRALRALGGKALARLAAMLGTLRDRVRPRQVLRPVPGGAR